MRLQAITRRFRCDVATCWCRIFAERFGGEVPAEHARRVARLDHIVHYFGSTLGGRPAACLARRLMLPVSNNTLLLMVRRQAQSRTEPLAVIGIDDWALRRNQRYGTIICDSERRRIVTLLADREIDTVAAWLAANPARPGSSHGSVVALMAKRMPKHYPTLCKSPTAGISGI